MQYEGNKRIAKNVIFLYIRMFLLLLIGFYTSRIVLDKLGEEDFGLSNVLGSLLTLLTFIQAGSASSASRFMSYEIGIGTKESQNKVFCMTLNIHIIYSVFLFIFSQTVGLWYFYNVMVIPQDRINAAFIVYQLSCLSSVFAVLIVPYMSMIISYEKMKSFAYLSIVEAIAKLIIVFCLFIDNVDKLVLFTALSFLVQVSVNLLYFLYCKRSFDSASFRPYWDKKMFKEIAVFSGLSTCSYISSSFVNQCYNLMLNVFFGPIVNAARGISFIVQSKILNFSTNFQIALNPQIVKNYAAENIERVIELVKLSTKISFSLMLILVFPIFVNINGILSIWLVDVPKDTNIFVVLVCFTAIFSTMSNPFSVIAESANRLKLYNSIVVPFFLLSLPFAYIALIMGCKAYVIFVIQLIFEFAGMYIKFLIACSIIRNKMYEEFSLLIKCMLSLVFFCILGYFLSKVFDQSILVLLFSLLFCVGIACVWVYLVILEKPERFYVKTKIVSYIK